jgi:hypothetical protein
MWGRSPLEIRLTASEWQAGGKELYFENDNPGVHRLRRLDIDPTAMTPEKRGTIGAFFKNIQARAAHDIASSPTEMLVSRRPQEGALSRRLRELVRRVRPGRG